MHPEQATVWYRRMSVVYAMGAWSVLGSAIFLTRKQKASGDGAEPKDDGSRSESPVSDLERDINEPIEGLSVKTYVKYSEDFVPVTQRIMDYLRSWTSGPGPES
ncbi:small integral membrane protein 26 [Peromyscus maniculatus bairdii]|uniref:Small integral membrane protein 26 n=1 Tax=Peromyscus maniculatus bairdii TaxID=230844 RepID=A0A6I9LSX6_PERMB|nr:small integral membrane protein 26 isoform X2 [Peromyscus maniculatus bairdii]